MKTIKFRDLRADELELRVGATTESGFSLLIYKTARADANVLDETVGVFNWQKRFYQVKNTMICSIGINVNYDDENKEPYWVWKDDAGDESNTEAIKGEASDSFKRAGFAYSIARKLYNSPFIWLNKDNNNDPRKTHYAIKEIGYDDTTVVRLVIINEKTKQEVFTYGVNRNSKRNTEVNPVEKDNDSDDENKPIRAEEKAWLQNYTSSLSKELYDRFKGWLKDNFHVDSIGELTASQGIIAVARLKGGKK